MQYLRPLRLTGYAHVCRGVESPLNDFHCVTGIGIKGSP
jgi:hypothetical protein